MITCSTAYRISPAEPLTEVDRLRLEDGDSTESISYIYLELHAQFVADKADEQGSLNLWVTPTGDEKVIVAQVYQLAPEAGRPDDQFRGEHGFTGLTSAFDPVSGAELQYWCETEYVREG